MQLDTGLTQAVNHRANMCVFNHIDMSAHLEGDVMIVRWNMLKKCQSTAQTGQDGLYGGGGTQGEG